MASAAWETPIEQGLDGTGIAENADGAIGFDDVIQQERRTRRCDGL